MMVTVVPPAAGPELGFIAVTYGFIGICATLTGRTANKNNRPKRHNHFLPGGIFIFLLLKVNSEGPELKG